MFKKISIAVTFSLLGVAGIVSAGNDKVLVCHKTNSDKNPVVLISVSANAVQAHLNHGDALLATDATECPTGVPLPE